MKFGSLIKQLLPRVVIALAIIGLAVFFLIWQPYARARNVVLSEIGRREENHSQRQSLNKLLTSLRSPDSISTQQPGAFRTYANELRQAADGIKDIELTPPPKLPPVHYTPVPALKSLVNSVNSIITDPSFGQRYRQSRVALTSADELISYHADIIRALTNVLEYNPAADFKTFDISSTDTRQRLELAKNGLDRASSQINDAAVSYNDPYISSVIEALSRLQQARKALEKSGDTSGWSQVVRTEQLGVIKNRAVFWKTESSRILVALSGVEKELQLILERWKQLKTNFEL